MSTVLVLVEHLDAEHGTAELSTAQQQGLEPANTAHIQGRRSAQETGSLPLLGAGESITYRMSFEFDPARREQP